MRNFKKLLALVLVLAMSVSFVLPAVAKNIDEFADAAASATALAGKGTLETEYGRAAQLMIDLNVLEGNANGSLGLGDKLTRGQFLVMLYKAKTGGQSIDGTNYEKMPDYFGDTKGEWYRAYANWVGVTGISAGIGDNRFGGWRDIDFDEALLLCMKAIGLDTDAENFVYSSATVRSTAYALNMMGDLYPLDEINPFTGKELIDRATACLLFQYTIFSEQVKYMDNGRRFRTGDSTVWGFGGGAGGQGSENPSWTLASEVFRLVHGVFTVVTDGVYFGLPEITDWIGPVTNVNNGGVGTSDGRLGTGRAIIQRPRTWDRVTGHVATYESFILSEEDTEALGIDLYKVGHKLYLIFRNPDWQWTTTVDTIPTPGDYLWTYHPGRQNNLAIEKFYSEPIWLSTVEEHTNISKAQADAWNANWNLRPRTFIDYSNDSDGTRAYLRAHWNEFSSNDRKLRTDNGNIRENEWQNAEIRTVSYDGTVEYVFIENYVVHKIGDINDEYGSGENGITRMQFTRQLTPAENVACEWTNTIQGGQYNNSANGSRGVALEQFLFGMGEDWGWMKGEYIAVCPIVGSVYWDEVGYTFGDGGNYYMNYLAKEVLDSKTGNVTSVRYNADFYNGGALVDNGTGLGDMILDGDTYVMSDSVNSRIKNFNTFDNNNERTIILWKGQIVEARRDPVPTQYCVVTAAGVSLRSTYNSNSATYYVDIVMEDGSIKTGLVLDRIVMSNGTPLTTPASLTGGNFSAVTAGAFGARPEDNESGSGQDGDPIWFKTADTSSSTIFKTAQPIKGHVFRYIISGSKVILYEDDAQREYSDKNSDNTVVATVNGRFNATWGPVLGQLLPGHANTFGLLTSDATRVIVRTLDTNGNDRYRVYTRNIPGFVVPTGQLTTESLRGVENGTLSSKGAAGNYVRFAYIDAVGASVSNLISTHWGVALGTGYDITDATGARVGWIDAMIAGNKNIRLQTIEYEAAGNSVLSLLRKGDVFIYDSEDGSPTKIFNIIPAYADYLTTGGKVSGDGSMMDLVADNGADLGSTYGLIGNNYTVHESWYKNEAGPLSNAALKADLEGHVTYNVYAFAANTNVNYSNFTETLFVAKDLTTTAARAGTDNKYVNTASGDRRNGPIKIAEAIAAIEGIKINNVSNNSLTAAQVADAITAQIKGIAASYGVTLDGGAFALGVSDINVFGALADGTWTVSIPSIPVSFQEIAAVSTTAVTKSIPNAGGLVLGVAALKDALEGLIDEGKGLYEDVMADGMGDALIGGLDTLEATVDIDMATNTITLTLQGTATALPPLTTSQFTAIAATIITGEEPYDSTISAAGITYWQFLAYRGFLPAPYGAAANNVLWDGSDPNFTLKSDYAFLGVNLRPLLTEIGITGTDSFDIRRLTPAYFEAFFLPGHAPANISFFEDGLPVTGISWNAVSDASTYNCNRVGLVKIGATGYEDLYFQIRTSTGAIYTIVVNASGVTP